MKIALSVMASPGRIIYVKKTITVLIFSVFIGIGEGFNTYQSVSVCFGGKEPSRKVICTKVVRHYQ